MPSFHHSGGGIEVEYPMFPTQPPTSNGAPSSKRKAPEDGDPFGRSNKKSKADNSTLSNGTGKRKLPGEEKLGGLVIVRGPPVLSTEARRAASVSRAVPAEDRASKSTSSASVSSSRPTTKPSSSSHAEDFVSRTKKSKVHPQAIEEVAEDDVDEDVRQMNSEADELRDRSRASLAQVSPDAPRVEFRFPAPKPPSQPSNSRVRQLQAEVHGLGTPPSQAGSQDTLIPLVERETPQILKNKMMRGEHPSMKQTTASRANPKSSEDSLGKGSAPGSQASGHRRRTSMSMRGKRISATFEATGIITKPHASVSDTSLYKHIDSDLPEAERIRQLLIWTTSRAMEPLFSTSSSGRSRKSISNRKPPDRDFSPLPPGGEQLLKDALEELVRQIAEKRIDTSGYGGPSGESSSSAWTLKENEQNVRNRAREKLFTETIEERRKEDTAWAEVGQFYETHKANMLASLNQRQRARTPLSAKAKGKQRAASNEPEDLGPWESELPEHFHGSKGYDIAKSLVQAGVEGVCKGDSRRQDLLYKEDCLHSAVNVAQELVRITGTELDRRFELLSISLAQSSIPSSNLSSSNKQSSLSNFVPVTSTPFSRSIGTDPQDLLRAISRVDAMRPRSQLDDAARRAAKDIQRANESVIQSGDSSRSLSERRLKDVPPPTPRKAPGTPKRPTTPGTTRR